MIFSNGRELNMKKVIRFIRDKGPISRKEISKKMDIPSPTISRIVEELLQKRVIKEVGTVPSHRGRRQVLLSLNAGSYYAIGVGISKVWVRVALVDLDGNIMNFKSKKMVSSDQISDLIEDVKRMAAQVVEEMGIDDNVILGMGVGLPAMLAETKNGHTMLHSLFYGEKEVNLRSQIEASMPYPVIVDNNANVAAVAEKWFGKGIGVSNMFCVFAESGVGSGIIINDHLYRGMLGRAGEIGHAIIDMDGALCYCGSYGCVETLVSVPIIVEKVKKGLRLGDRNEMKYFEKDIEQIEFEDIEAASHSGSPLALQVLGEAGRVLGTVICNAIQHFSPGLIVLGGKLSTSHPVVAQEIRRMVDMRRISYPIPDTPIVVSELSEVIVLGAAAQVIDHEFALFSPQ